MCVVKSGAKIKNLSDFQNLVIGIILRQSNSYKEKDIVNAVTFHSRNAEISIDSKLVSETVKDNLVFLQRTNRLRCIDGVYKPLSIEQY